MIEENNANHDTSKTDNGHSDSKSSHLRWVFICGGIAIVGLLIASICWPYLTERTKFFTANLLNLVIALAVIAQVLIYRKQWYVMDAQWRAMKEQTEHAQRAYVCIPKGNMKIVYELPARKEGGMIGFNLRVENFGNTPANDVRIYTFTEIVTDVPDPALKVAGKEPFRIGLIGPHADTEHWVRSPELSREDDQRWAKGDIKVCCGGVITYNTFGETRTTKFCVLQKVRTIDVEPYGKWSEGD